MEAIGAAGGVVLLAVAWYDLRKKMNGGGSIAQKDDLSRLETKVDDVLAWQKDHVQRWHN